MPLFEFKCQKCGQQFEELVSSADEKIPCPACGSAEIRKLVSLVASSQHWPHAGHSSSCGSSGKFT